MLPMSEISIVDEKKYHKLDPTKKLFYIATSAIFFLLVIPALLYSYYNVALTRPNQNDRETIFKIERGEGASSISSRLYEANLINSKALFNIYVLSSSSQSELQAGVYMVPAGYNVKQVVELFGRGTNDLRITFLEGWRLEEVAQEASEKFNNIGYEKFVELGRPYEGKLFPDTYDFNTDVTEEVITQTMRDNFTAKTREILTPQALSKIGLSEDQVIVLASIVEREVRIESDKKIVAGILLKRLNDGGLLGADATTQYAVAPKGDGTTQAWWPHGLTSDDLNSDSPYNTRKMPGLPPTPICNPGLSSIKAVLQAENTKYYYYLNDPLGATHFSQTLDEHNKNVAKYL